MTYCSRCGNQLAQSDKFCGSCGDLQESQPDSIDQSQDWSIYSDDIQEFPEDENRKGKNKRKGIALIVILALVALTLAGSWMFLRPSPQMTFSDAMERGNYYLVELNFEQAEVYFRRAIDIDPKHVQPYIELAFIYYEHFDDVEQALEILERGMHEVDEEDIPDLIEVWGGITTLPLPISINGNLDTEVIPEGEPEEPEEEPEEDPEEEPEEVDLVWSVLPNLEHDRIILCDCGVFRDSDWNIIDPTTGILTGNQHLGHGPWLSPAWVYDLDRGLFGDPGYGGGYYYLLGMHLYEQFMNIYLSQDRTGWQDIFDEWFEEIINAPMIIQRVDSSRREYQEVIPGTQWWFLTQNAYLGEFAIMYRGDFVTDFIFEGSAMHLSLMRSEGFYYAIVRMDGRWGIVDENGDIIVPFVFDQMLPIDGDTVFAKYNGFYGILDIHGTIESTR